MERLAIEGAPFVIGEALGKIGRPAVNVISASAEWERLRGWRDKPEFHDLMQRTKADFPRYWEELRGMSAGLEMDLTDVFLWNCRLDLPAVSEAVSSSIVVKRLGTGWLIHKARVDAALVEHCRLVDVMPDGEPGFLSLYVPGCIPGHTFAANSEEGACSCFSPRRLFVLRRFA